MTMAQPHKQLVFVLDCVFADIADEQMQDSDALHIEEHHENV